MQKLYPGSEGKKAGTEKADLLFCFIFVVSYNSISIKLEVVKRLSFRMSVVFRNLIYLNCIYCMQFIAYKILFFGVRGLLKILNFCFPLDSFSEL